MVVGRDGELNYACPRICGKVGQRWEDRVRKPRTSAGPYRDIFPTQASLNCKVGADLPAIGDEIVLVCAAELADSNPRRIRGSKDVTSQEVSERVTGCGWRLKQELAANPLIACIV